MLAPSYYPRAGGVEKHVRMVCRELQVAGHDIRIATPRWDEGGSEQEIVDGIEVTRLSLDKRRGRRQLAPLVKWADIVHTHDAYPFLKYYLPFRFRYPLKPVFVTFHGYEGYPIPFEAKVLRRVVLGLTSGNICAGAFIPKWYRFRCGKVTYGGTAPTPPAPSPRVERGRTAPTPRPPPHGEDGTSPPGPLSLLSLQERGGTAAAFVGRLEADTGFLTYLEALRLLRTKHGLALPLQVCGDGSLRAEGERIAAEAGLEVTFHGRVPDVTPYLAGARFVFTSGFLGMLEAMAAGAVVCAVYDNPLKEDYLRLFPGAESILIAGSAAELARGVSELTGDAARAAALVETGRAFAQEQTWAKVAELYLDLYKGTVTPGRSLGT